MDDRDIHADEDLVQLILDEKLHAGHFTYRGVRYTFSGWWLLEAYGEGDLYLWHKEYDRWQDFLEDPLFDGRMLAEIQPELEDIFIEL